MSHPDRLEELRSRALPHLIRAIAERGGTVSLATLNTTAVQRFDGLLTGARIWHHDHPHEDAQMHQAHLLQIFVEAGIPAPDALPIVEEFVLIATPAP